MSQEPTWLFCIGAQKAGTTWLYGYLQDHAQVHVPPVKEVHYFDAMFDPVQAGVAHQRRDALARSTEPMERFKRAVRPWMSRRTPERGFEHSVQTLRRQVRMYEERDEKHSAYRSFMLHGYEREACVADVTPSYAVVPRECFELMAADFPNARFLFILRDPIARTWSSIKMQRLNLSRRSGSDVSEADILDAIEDGGQEHIIQRSKYETTLDHLDNVVGSDRALVLYYEELFSSAAMRKLCAFIGVDFVPGAYESRVHQGDAKTLPPDQWARLARILRPTYERLDEMLGGNLPAAWDTQRVLSGDFAVPSSEVMA